jgi:PAS domain S-box-containing protein
MSNLEGRPLDWIFQMTDETNEVMGLNVTQAGLREKASLLAIAERVGRMGNWRLDLRSGRLVWSEATCELFGIKPAEFAESYDHFNSFILAEDLPAYVAVHARVTPMNPLSEAEYRIRRSDGVVRWMYERGQVEFDATGVPIRRVGIVMDITEQHEVREQRAQDAVLLAQIAGKAASLGGWTIQLPDRKLTWSDENCAIHEVPAGYTPTLDEGIGYYPAEYRAQVTRHVDECMRDGTPYDFELPKYTAKGRLIWVRSIGEAVRDANGEITGLQGAFQDITRSKQIEAEKEKLIKELQDALLEVKTLRDFLPICSYCKKVRDDQNYWSQIENYISKHTATKFTHGICPECYELEVGPQLEEMKRIRAERRDVNAPPNRVS